MEKCDFLFVRSMKFTWRKSLTKRLPSRNLRPLSHVEYVLLPEAWKVIKLICFLIPTYRCLHVLQQENEKKNHTKLGSSVFFPLKIFGNILLCKMHVSFPCRVDIYLHEKNLFSTFISVQEGIPLLLTPAYKPVFSTASRHSSMCLTVIFNKNFSN